MDDRNRPKHPPLVPRDTDREDTDRISLPISVSRAFDRTDEKIQSLSDACELRYEAMRKRAHDLANDINAHEFADIEFHADLTGKSGTNGRLGALGARIGAMESWKKWVVGAIGSAALLLGSGIRFYVAQREQWASLVTEVRQLRADVDYWRGRAEEHRAALIRAGLLFPMPPLPTFPPAASPASTPDGDEP